MHASAALAVATLVTMLPHAAAAQPSSAVPAVTVTGGRADFVDDRTVVHGVVGGGLEWLPTPHIAVGPEVLYMVGPNADRDVFVLGVARIGFRPLRARVSPFVTAGAGMMSHSDRLAGGPHRSTEGAFVVGAGVRINASPRVFIAPETVVGWEAHLRYSVTVGIRLR